jgi:ribulose-phosphate 3-epimerase
MNERFTLTKDQTIAALRAASPAILPSLLMCDFSRLADEIARLEAGGAKVLHLDVMDGHFTGNFTYGLTVVEAARRCTRLPLDAHLMIERPACYVEAFRQAGADVITIHIEAEPNPAETLAKIRDCGAAAGLALNPATPLEAIEPHLALCDLILVMSVPAGFGGQPFDDRALDKLARLKAQLGERCLLEIDGGIAEGTIQRAARAGADLFVVGSAIFKHADYAERIAALSSLARGDGT